MLLYDFLASDVQLPIFLANGPARKSFAEGGFADFLAGTVGFGVFGSADDFVHGDRTLGKWFVEERTEGGRLELEEPTIY